MSASRNTARTTASWLSIAEVHCGLVTGLLALLGVTMGLIAGFGRGDAASAVTVLVFAGVAAAFAFGLRRLVQARTRAEPRTDP